MEPSLTFRSLINFKLIFMSRERQRCSFILFHVNIQFSQEGFLKSVFSPLSILGSLLKYQLTLYALVYFWAYAYSQEDTCLKSTQVEGSIKVILVMLNKCLKNCVCTENKLLIAREGTGWEAGWKRLRDEEAQILKIL